VRRRLGLSTTPPAGSFYPSPWLLQCCLGINHVSLYVALASIRFYYTHWRNRLQRSVLRLKISSLFRVDNLVISVLVETPWTISGPLIAHDRWGIPIAPRFWQPARVLAKSSRGGNGRGRAHLRGELRCLKPLHVLSPASAVVCSMDCLPGVRCWFSMSLAFPGNVVEGRVCSR